MTEPRPALADRLVAAREALLDEVAFDLRSSIPTYLRVDAGELRASLAALLDELIAVVRDGRDRRASDAALAEMSKRRHQQGFTSTDILHASLRIRPVVHRVLTDADPADLAALDAMLQERAVAATNVFVDEVTRRLEAKNQALRRMNDELEAHRAALDQKVAMTTRALSSARTLNAKVIESLASGVVVIEADTYRVLVYSPVAERILERPAEEVLGQPMFDAVAGIDGLDVDTLVEQVLRNGELPLTKRRLVLPGGRVRWVYLSARRLVDDQGAHEGTVVVIDDVSERELLLDSFSRYVSRDVVRRLLARGSVELGGERRQVTVLFADIRGFSGLAERLSPEALHELLNRYFRVMIAAVTDEGGFVDKFVGDKVMAIFGHDATPDHGAGSAVRAARALQRGCAALGDDPPVRVGVGVNTGEVVLGNVGSELRMEFTAIGDAVNIADRLQSLARGGEILVGPATAAGLDGVPLRARGPVALRGRQGDVEVFEVG